jgi:deoxyribodipyrimidine photo-lyase
MTAILWFRQDLRLYDNPALLHLSQHHDTFIPIYIWDETFPYPMGSAQKWWLHHSLHALQKDLKAKHNATLLLRRGNPQEILEKIILKTNSSGLFWNCCYDPYSLKRDQKIKEHLSKRIKVESFNGSLLFEPSTILNQSKKPFRVFTPFYKACITRANLSNSIPSPANCKGVSASLQSDILSDWNLLPTQPNWAKKFEQFWIPGEEGAQQQLKEFLKKGLPHYAEARDFPSKRITSRLSPYLHFGEVSPHQIWSDVQHSKTDAKDIRKFQSELMWREFSYYLLFHFPTIPHKNFKSAFNKFKWSENK